MSMLENAPPVHSHPQGGADEARSAGMALPTRKIALGEELPIFCEKCGYALHGLPQMVCEQCTIRQFKCPECGHHQPINTFRPAAQKALGRVRAVFLVFVVFFKINFFGWILFGWCAWGTEAAYEFDSQSYYNARSQVAVAQNTGAQPTTRKKPMNEYWMIRSPQMEELFGETVLALFFGLIGRMLLLRWRRGYLVGLTMGALVVTAMILGAFLTKANRDIQVGFLVAEYFMQLGLVFVGVVSGASIVWGVWTALAHLFLPKRTSKALLDWQSAQSQPAVAQLGRE